MSLHSEGCNGLDAEKVALRQPYVDYSGWRCCHASKYRPEPREIFIFPLLPDDALDADYVAQEDTEIILFAASWPAPVFRAETNRDINSRAPVAQLASPFWAHARRN